MLHNLPLFELRVNHITIILTCFLLLTICFFSTSCEKIPNDPIGEDDGKQYRDSGDFQFTGGNDCSDCYPGTEKFGELTYNSFVYTEEDNLSTFGIDVDNGSYTFGRKKINEGHLPPKESVRVEEYVNYFRQDYDPPTELPFSVAVDGAPSPFRGDSLHILRIGLQGMELSNDERKPWNLTFLIDVSGSMETRLDWLKKVFISWLITWNRTTRSLFVLMPAV